MNSLLVSKVLEGLTSQGWNIIGRGGSWGSALRPLEAYIQRKIARAVKEEREACAKVCDGVHARHTAEYGDYIGETYAAECGRNIRARSKK